MTNSPEAGTSPSGTSPTGTSRSGTVPPGTLPPDLRAAAVFAVDLLAVVVFVLLGRSSHGEDEGVSGVLVTLWPFLTGLLAGWLLLLLTRTRPAGRRAGIALVVATVVVGMVLRHTVSHDGTPPSFVIVASAFLTLAYVGWRMLAAAVRRRRAA